MNNQENVGHYDSVVQGKQLEQFSSLEDYITLL